MFGRFQGILGSGFALQVANHQRQKHITNRKIPAAVLIQVRIRVLVCICSTRYTDLPLISR